MTDQRRDFGTVLLQAMGAGAVTALPLAAWILARALPFNSLELEIRFALGAFFALGYAAVGIVFGAACGAVVYAIRRGRCRGYLAGSLPLVVALGARVTQTRIRVDGDPRLFGAIAAALLLVTGLVVARRLLPGRGGRMTVAGAALGLVLVAVTSLRDAGPATSGDPEVRSRLDALPAGPRLVVFALDGVEPEILEERVRDGDVPHLASLMRRGSHGPMQTMEPTWSPPIWTSVWTGKLPRDHGITYFVSRGTYRFMGRTVIVPRLLGVDKMVELVLPRVTIPVNQRQRRATTVWEALGLAGRGSVLANRIVSWPALPLRGVELTDRLLRGDATIADQAYPPELTESTLARLASIAPRSDPRLAATPWLAQGLSKERELWRIAAEEAASREASLLIAYTHLIDSAQHRYLKYHWSDRYRFEVSPADEAAFGEVVTATYRAVDDMVGDVLKTLDPGDYVLVISDHGVRPNLDLTEDVSEPAQATSMPPVADADVSGVHGKAPDGVFVLAGPGVAPGRLTWKPHVLELAPLMLNLLGLPAADDMARPSPLVAYPSLAASASAPDNVGSYEGWIPRRPQAISTTADEAILDELRALGYIE